MNREGKDWQVAVYARISVKHQNRKDLSIDNQIAVCRRFLLQKEIKNEIIIYSDLGWSGMTWERPAFDLLKAEICRGRIPCVAVKDFSRLGRNYRKVGEFTERFLPAHGVRLLSAAENYDSDNWMGNSVTIGIHHLLNEWYAKDIGRKVALVKQEKRKKGEYLGSVAPYGYCIVQKDGMRQLVRDKSYEILERILLLHQEGYSSEEISNWLWQHNVNPPSVYRKTGEVVQKEGDVIRWQSGTIRNLLKKTTG